MSTTARSRIVPPAFRSAELRLEGEAPLLMHADTLLDITHPLTRQFKELTAKGSAQRTMDDNMNIARVEWLAGLYYDEALGPYVPGAMVKRAITEAATRLKKGAPLKRGLVVVQTKIPLEYDGPRDLEGLWDEGFRDMRGAVNSGRNSGRVMRCRPCFEEWALTAEVAYDPTECDADTLAAIAEFAQVRGIGDFRPEFGTFAATWTELS
jgi:hypothetical protein